MLVEFGVMPVGNMAKVCIKSVNQRINGVVPPGAGAPAERRLRLPDVIFNEWRPMFICVGRSMAGRVIYHAAFTA